MDQYVFIITAFIICFVIIWTAVSSLIASVSGWKKLSQLFVHEYYELNDVGPDYRMTSIRMGLMNYRASVTITFLKAGMFIEVMKIFSMGHKPVYIPYSRIGEIKRGTFLFVTYVSFIVEKIKIVVYGKAGDALLSKLKIS